MPPPLVELLLQPHAWGLIGLVVIDLIFGDPRSLPHPIVMIGNHLRKVENFLFAHHCSGRWGGILLTCWLLILCNTIIFSIVYILMHFSYSLAYAFCFLICGWLLAYKSLQEHGIRVFEANSNQNIKEARLATSYLVGRDTKIMNEQACARATMESLSENLVDGILAPLFWYMILGPIGMLSFKIVSTLDSMIGYKNERYFYFGWAGARLDDIMNFIPARLGFLLIVAAARLRPQFSAPKAWAVAWKQHNLLPSPNSGWAEAAAAGALQIKLVGPIYRDGILTTTIWIGDPEDPEGGSIQDLKNMATLIRLTTMLMVGMGLIYCVLK